MDDRNEANSREKKDPIVKVIYGPEDDPEKYTVDLWNSFQTKIGGGAINPSDIVVNVSSYYPGYPYFQTDRSTMPSHYPCMGSASAHVHWVIKLHQ